MSTPAPSPPSPTALPLPESRPVQLLPLLVVFVIALGMLITLRSMGRIWWCALGDWWPWTLEAWGPHNSQHVIDPYVFSHLLHGVIFFFAFNWGVLKRSPLWGLVCATVLEAAWEIFENTPFTIDRYRAATAAVGYTGDSVINSMGDLAACIGGWFLARAIGLWWSIALYLALEIGCALWIRDNLTLNVIMILHPIESVKAWQSGS